MNTLESLNTIDLEKNKDNLLSVQKKFGFNIPSSFSNLLTEYCVAKPKLTSFKKNNIKFDINYFFGFSEKSYQDFVWNYNTYLGRMPQEFFPIASANGGDLLCMDKQNENIFYWFHEKDDWGLEGNKERPVKVAENLNDFIEFLIEPESPTELEIELAKKQAKATKTTPIALKFKNEARAKKGLPPLKMEDLQ